MKHRVLIADDNRDAAESLAMMLELLGKEVKVTYDGQEAVDAVAAFRPDLIILDLGMPRLSGLDACREIRKSCLDVKIVALTGWGRTGDRVLTAEAGFDEHFVKPIDLPTLKTLLA